MTNSVKLSSSIKSRFDSFTQAQGRLHKLTKYAWTAWFRGSWLRDMEDVLGRYCGLILLFHQLLILTCAGEQDREASFGLTQH